MVGDGKHLQANQLLLPIELKVPRIFIIEGVVSVGRLIICQN